MRKTNPISPGRRRLTEEILQNKAKLGMTGVCGQRRLPCGPWLGRGVKCAKRTQFRSPEVPHGGDCAKRTQFPRPEAADEGNCAKRSQTWGDWGMWAKAAVVWDLARPRSETCKTNPISGSRRRCWAGMANPRSGRGQALRGQENAKRSQSGVRPGMGAG
jgi:hypothetical protein